MIMMATSDLQWQELRKRLKRSRFRNGFVLGENERAYVYDRTLPLIHSHACDFVRQRLSPAWPRNDGKQTPLKGHPVFVAQHATGTCCRECLAKWHGIPEGKALNNRQMHYVVEVIMRWIQEQMENERSEKKTVLPVTCETSSAMSLRA
jgi:hypothetical protein